MTESNFDVAIVGGGIEGCSVALELFEKEEKDYKLKATIYESNNSLLMGTADSTLWRLHIGSHYKDKSTAIKCLRSTISFLKKHGVQYIYEPDNPLHRVQYYLVCEQSDEMTEKCRKLQEESDTLLKELQKEYARLVTEDPSNAVFGPVEKFYRPLKKEEYVHKVNTNIVLSGVETFEPTLDWIKLKKDLMEKIHQQVEKGNIVLKTNTEIDKVSFNFEKRKFELTSKGQKFDTDIFVNTSWVNYDQLNETLAKSMGITQIGTSYINRVKVVVEVPLPPQLKNSPPMFFHPGAHSSWTHKENDTAIIAYEPVTNLEVKQGLEQLSIDAQMLLARKAPPEREKDLVSRIIGGAQNYVPDMKYIDCSQGHIKAGIVKTKNDGRDIAITDPLSGIHKRDYSGVERLGPPGATGGCALKLVYSADDAKEITSMIKEDCNLLRLGINKILDDDIIKRVDIVNTIIKLTRMIEEDKDKSVSIDKKEKQLIHQIQMQAELIREIKRENKKNEDSNSGFHLFEEYHKFCNGDEEKNSSEDTVFVLKTTITETTTKLSSSPSSKNGSPVTSFEKLPDTIEEPHNTMDHHSTAPTVSHKFTRLETVKKIPLNSTDKRESPEFKRAKSDTDINFLFQTLPKDVPKFFTGRVPKKKDINKFLQNWDNFSLKEEKNKGHNKNKVLKI